MRMLIVDDEIFVRMGIKTTVDWSEHGFERVLEAEDGVEAEALFIKYKPDIVLVDILMPKMNGLEFIARVKGLNPYCRFIIMSCHNEFEYMREAIKLGVKDYIMKTSIKRDELVEVVKSSVKEIEEERIRLCELSKEKRMNYVHRPIIIRDFLNDIIEGVEYDETTILKKIEELQIELTIPGLFLASIVIDNYSTLKLSFDAKHYELLTFGVTNIAHEIIKNYANGCVIRKDDRTIICFISLQNSGMGMDYKAVFDNLCTDIITSVNEFLNIKISIGISREVTSFREITSAYKAATQAVGKRFFAGRCSIHYTNEKYSEDEVYIQMLSAAEQNVIRAIVNSDETEAEKAVEALKSFLFSNQVNFTYSDVQKIKDSIFRILFNILRVAVSEGVSEEEIRNINFNAAAFFQYEYLSDILDYWKWMLDKVFKLLEQRYAGRSKSIISSVKEYLHKNFDKEISLNDAAAYVNLSPGYFSKLFKRETGQNYIDYVLKIKMEKAKSLINEGVKLYAIAYQLGYTEISSFSRIFKKIEGVSPKQYRARHIKR